MSAAVINLVSFHLLKRTFSFLALSDPLATSNPPFSLSPALLPPRLEAAAMAYADVDEVEVVPV